MRAHEPREVQGDANRTANASAHQPYAAMPAAAPQSGATAMRSRATNQMHTYGPKLTSMETAESAQPR